MNSNQIEQRKFSNPDTFKLHEQQGHFSDQCGGCSFFAPLNTDYGLCLNQESIHSLETVFEHFGCPNHVQEGWGPHSFTKDAAFHCRCGEEPVERHSDFSYPYDELYEKIENYSTQEPPYDYVGVIHLLGASLTNLRINANEAELEEICNCLSDEQIAFLKRLATIAEQNPPTD
jgi:hypothetical protein